MKIKNLIVITSIISLLVLGCQETYQPITKLKVEKRGGKVYYGDAYLEERDGITLVHLKGSPYEIGYQHGILLKDEIKEEYRDYKEEVKKMIRGKLPKFLTRWQSETLDNIFEAIGKPIFYYLFVRKLEKHIPQEFIDEMKGISDAANIDYYSVIMGNVGYELVLKFLFCTSFAASPPATKENELLHGRNLDWWPPELVSKTTTIFFVTPDKGYPFVSIAPAAAVGVATGMNIKGITISMNSSFCRENTLNGFPVGFMLRKIIQYTADLEDGVKIVTDSKRTTGGNILITDGKIKKAKVIEYSLNKYAIREMKNGSIFTTNHYVDKSMKKEQKYAIERCPRYDRLKVLFKENFNKIDVEEMIEFLRDRYNYQTGKIDCYAPRSINSTSNAQSVVFSPTDLSFWVANKKKAAVCDGEYIGFNLKNELNLIKGKVRDYKGNPYVKTDGYKSFGHYEKGWEYLKGKKVKKAKIEFEKAIKLEPECASLYLQLGDIYYGNAYDIKDYDSAIKDYGLAIKYYNKVIELASPHKEHFQLNGIYLELGYAYLSNKNYQQAISTFEKVFDNKPNKFLKIYTCIKLGQSYDCLGKRKEALSFYKKALALKPKNKRVINRVKKYIKRPFDIKEL